MKSLEKTTFIFHNVAGQGFHEIPIHSLTVTYILIIVWTKDREISTLDLYCCLDHCKALSKAEGM